MTSSSPIPDLTEELAELPDLGDDYLEGKLGIKPIVFFSTSYGHFRKGREGGGQTSYGKKGPESQPLSYDLR